MEIPEWFMRRWTVSHCDGCGQAHVLIDRLCHNCRQWLGMVTVNNSTGQWEPNNPYPVTQPGLLPVPAGSTVRQHGGTGT